MPRRSAAHLRKRAALALADSGHTTAQIADALDVAEQLIKTDLGIDDPTDVALRRQQIAHLHGKGLSIADMMAHFGLARTTIADDLKALGIDLAAERREHLAERQRRAAAMARSGHTVLDIAHELGICETRVYADLNAAGCPAPAKIARDKRRRDVADLTRQGYSAEQIAATLHLHPDTVLSDRHASGIWRTLTDEQIAEGRARLEAGERIKDVAADLGCHPSTLRRKVPDARVKNRGRPAGTGKQIDDRDLRHAFHEVASGAPADEVARRLTVSSSHLYRLFRDAGWNLRAERDRRRAIDEAARAAQRAEDARRFDVSDDRQCAHGCGRPPHTMAAPAFTSGPIRLAECPGTSRGMAA